MSEEEQREDDDLINLDEAVQVLGTSRPTLYRLLSQGDIKGLKVGRQWRFRRADLQAYMERGPVALTAASTEDLDAALASLSGTFDPTADPETPWREMDAEGKTNRLCELVLKEAIAQQASDIHIEPQSDCVRLRLRIDGVLQELARFPKGVQESMIVRIKTLADMVVAEKRVPQDGRIPVKHKGLDYDVRVNCIPNFFGESLVMRILYKNSVLLGLENLGVASDHLVEIEKWIHQPSGIIIATGPSGSGKSTLLYSCLHKLNDPGRKIVTVEDPVEYILPGVNQSQVNVKAGLTFARAMRSFMRQDSDVVMLGQMRDLETAQITIETSLIGQLVLTTLHTVDAAAAATRLVEMGIEPYLVNATLVGSIAMRLVRKICPDCLEEDTTLDPKITAEALRLASKGGFTAPSATTFYRGAGCANCRNKGYQGRTMLTELVRWDATLGNALLKHAPPQELTALAIAAGTRTLFADGIRKATEGLATLEDVFAATGVAV